MRRGLGARVADALDRVGLAAAAGKRYRAYSMGMRQRLGLAAALLKPRELLVLDEPTNGLDPQGTREVRAIIRDVGASGTTVFLSSHLLPEVEQVCSHVGVMSHGRLVFSGSLGELRSASASRVRIDTPEPAAAAASASPSRHRRAGDRSITASWPTWERPPAKTSPRPWSRRASRSVRSSWRSRTSRRCSSGSPGRASMSTSDLALPLPASASARPARRISTRLLRSELRLMFRRRRNLAMLAVLSTGPILLGLAINAAGPSPGDGPPFFAQVTQNGLFLGLASVLVALPLFLPLAVSVVSGEAVAGEASTGTLRNILVVPAGRTRLLVVKYVGVVGVRAGLRDDRRRGRHPDRPRLVPGRRRGAAVRHYRQLRRGVVPSGVVHRIHRSDACDRRRDRTSSSPR